MKAGVIVYSRQGRSLVGQWTHVDIQGALASEVVHDVAEGAVEGDWPVEILLPNGQVYYAGRLGSSKLGDALTLSWTGTYQNSGQEASFVGIGIAVTPDLIVATFEQAE